VPNTKEIPVSSSVPPRLPEEQEYLFREVLSTLNAAQVSYAVTGAYALQQHTGIWRQPKDLDICLTHAEMPKALKALEHQGYRCEVLDPIWLAKAHHCDFFVDLITGMSNAVLTVDEAWIGRAHPAEIVGVFTRVLAPEELLISKLFVSRRERFDGADIVHIMYATAGGLDWDRLLELIGEHWQMLLWALVLFAYVYPGQTGLVPQSVWQDLVGRFKTSIENLDPNAPFRGSLVDENMFAIDVREWGLKDELTGYRERRRSQTQPTDESR
jgi:putative nucleotidyltransferase-like protein